MCARVPATSWPWQLGLASALGPYMDGVWRPVNSEELGDLLMLSITGRTGCCSAFTAYRKNKQTNKKPSCCSLELVLGAYFLLNCRLRGAKALNGNVTLSGWSEWGCQEASGSAFVSLSGGSKRVAAGRGAEASPRRVKCSAEMPRNDGET